MGKEVTLYDLFQMNVLSDKDLLKIGKTANLNRIIIVYDWYPYDNKIKCVQIHYNEMFLKEFYPKEI